MGTLDRLFSGKFRSRAIQLSTYLAIAGLFSGCGGSAYREQQPGANNGSGGTSTTNPVTVTAPSPTPLTGGLSVYPFDFDITGIGGVKPVWTSGGEINTDTKLEVEVTLETAGTSQVPGVTGHNSQAPYTCGRFTVSLVDARTGQVIQDGVRTELMSTGNSVNCPNAPRSVTFSDLQQRLVHGHGPVKIQVSEAITDAYCETAVRACTSDPWYGGPDAWCRSYASNFYGWDSYSQCQSSTVFRPAYRVWTTRGKIRVRVNGPASSAR